MATKKPIADQRSIVHYIDMSKTVDVYRNLHTGLWSVRQGGVVRCHIDRLFMYGCRMVVSQNGRQRVLEEGRKNVHAVIRGKVCDDKNAKIIIDYVTTVGIREFDIVYDPYQHDSFMGYCEDSDLEPVHSAGYVDLDSSRCPRVVGYLINQGR